MISQIGRSAVELESTLEFSQAETLYLPLGWKRRRGATPSYFREQCWSITKYYSFFVYLDHFRSENV